MSSFQPVAGYRFMTIRNLLGRQDPQPSLAQRLAYLESPASLWPLTSRLVGKPNAALGLRIRLAHGDRAADRH